MSKYLAIEACLSGWRSVPFGRVAVQVELPRRQRPLPLLSLSSHGVVAERGADARQQPALDYIERYWTVSPGELVVNPMWLIGGGIGVSWVSGAVSPDYRVYRLTEDLEPRYVHHLVRSAPYREQYRLLVRAETTFDRRITKRDFEGLPIPIPPRDEQRAIADYLDRETARIDALISAKQRMLGLLAERRVATIAKHVMPSNRERPGWRLMRLRHVLHQIIDTEHKTAPFYDDGGFLVVRTSNVKAGRLVVGPDSKFTDAAGFREWTARGVPEPGDILFTREAPAGEACLVPPDTRVCIGQRMVLFKVEQTILFGPYALRALYGGIARSFIDELSQGSTVAHLNMSDISDIPLWVPTLEQQQEIAAQLDRATTQLDRLSEVLDEQVRLLTERRSALITDAVTGQVPVPA